MDRSISPCLLEDDLSQQHGEIVSDNMMTPYMLAAGMSYIFINRKR